MHHVIGTSQRPSVVQQQLHHNQVRKAVKTKMEAMLPKLNSAKDLVKQALIAPGEFSIIALSFIIVYDNQYAFRIESVSVIDQLMELLPNNRAFKIACEHGLLWVLSMSELVLLNYL